MDLKTSVKILVGTTISSLNKSKITGKLCLKDIYLLNIVNSFIIDCKECKNSSDLEKLNKISRNIQNSNKDICKTRYSVPNNIFVKENVRINNFFKSIESIKNCDGLNNPPSIVGDNNKEIVMNVTVLTRQDFTTDTTPMYQDPENDSAYLLKILTLPSEGNLVLNGNNVLINQIISFSDIDSGLLSFNINSISSNDRIIDFNFSIADAGSLTFTE